MSKNEREKKKNKSTKSSTTTFFLICKCPIFTSNCERHQFQWIFSSPSWRERERKKNTFYSYMCITFIFTLFTHTLHLKKLNTLQTHYNFSRHWTLIMYYVYSRNAYSSFSFCFNVIRKQIYSFHLSSRWAK